jgi:hypothetical protein
MTAFLYAVLQANAQTMREVMAMNKRGKTPFDEVLEELGLTAKWRAEGRVEGEARGEARVRIEGEKSAWEKMVSLLKLGYTADQLEQMEPSGFPVPGHA